MSFEKHIVKTFRQQCAFQQSLRLLCDWSSSRAPSRQRGLVFDLSVVWVASWYEGRGWVPGQCPWSSGLNDVSSDNQQDALDPKDISAVDEQGRFVKCSVCWRALQIFHRMISTFAISPDALNVVELGLTSACCFWCFWLVTACKAFVPAQVVEAVALVALVFIEIYIYCIHCRRGP